MALNVTTAVFRPGFNIATASPSLVQWDQGQMLQFEGVELPSAYQVEFTNAVTVQAITMIGNENGVEIPNELLQQSFPINAYIVLHETAEDRETEYWATIYVKARQKPREETPDPEQTSVIDQTIAALQEGVAEAQAAANEAEAASQAVQDMGVEAETLPEGSQATVEKTVDPDTGAVTLGFGIPEGRHGATGATPDIQIGTVTTGAPGSQAAASITGTREEPRLNLTIPQGPQGDAGVTSVNGKTGAVTLDAADVGAYAKPSGGIPKTDLDQSVQTSLGLANTALQSAPVTSVNNKTGAVVLSASDVGAKPASYEAPVSSVNEKTGAVVLDAGDIGYESTTVEDELGTINSALTSLSAVTEIIDTAAGAIASFPDGSGLPMRSLVAQINPVQDLHGQSSPYPAGGGKNLLDPVAVFGSDTDHYTVNSDGSITVKGSDGRQWVAIPEIPIKAGTYTYSRDALNGWCDIRLSTEDYATGHYMNATEASITFTMTEDGYYKTKCGYSASSYPFTVKLQLESGSTASAWTPYSNLCPISGWTGLQGYNDPKHGGLILWSEKVKDGNFPDATNWRAYGGTLSIADNVATVTLTGTVANLGTRIDTEPYLQRTAGHKYLSFAEVKVPKATTGGRFYPVGDKYAQNISVSANTWTQISALTTETSDNPQAKTQFFLGNSATDGYVAGDSFQIRNVNTFDLTEMFGAGNEPATAEEFRALFPKAYYPYNAGEETTVSAVNGDPYDEFSVSFGQTVYGGTDEVISGNGTSTMEFFERPLSDAFLVLTYTNTKRYRFSNIFSAPVDRAGSISNFAPSAYNADDFVHFYVDGRNCDVFVPVDADTSMVVQVCAPLSTPTTFTHEGQSVDTLVGQNNVWVDTGSVSVEYPADTKLYIDKKIAELAQ